MLRAALAVSMFGLACSCGCSKRGEAPKPAPSSAPSATGSASPSVPRFTQIKPGCRALAVTGKASADGAPITTGTLLDGEHWVELDAGASVSLRHTLTSRELKLIGPGLILPCRRGKEEVLLALGKVSTASNLGVRPGAEVLIATPVGTVHYGDAAIDVEFGPKGLRLRVNQGEAWLEPQDRSLPPMKNPLRSPKEAALPPSKTSASGLADACRVSAETAAEGARRVLGAGGAPAGGTLGERTAAHMRDRSAARAACSTAAAAAGQTTDPAERQSLWAAIAHSDELWQSVPR